MDESIQRANKVKRHLTCEINLNAAVIDVEVILGEGVGVQVFCFVFFLFFRTFFGFRGSKRQML